MFISKDMLLRGSRYALEQAGRLLHNAVTLFDGGDPSTAVVLAMFGREELGRSQFLRDLAAKVKAGQKLTAIQISKSCIEEATKAKRKRDTKSRHDARVQGLYVDLDVSGTSWICPASLSAQNVRDHMGDAMNDYAGKLDRLRNDVIEQDFPEMAAARARMNPIPVLPAPCWPVVKQDAG